MPPVQNVVVPAVMVGVVGKAVTVTVVTAEVAEEQLPLVTTALN